MTRGGDRKCPGKKGGHRGGAVLGKGGMEDGKEGTNGEILEEKRIRNIL